MVCSKVLVLSKFPSLLLRRIYLWILLNRAAYPCSEAVVVCVVAMAPCVGEAKGEATEGLEARGSVPAMPRTPVVLLPKHRWV